jgi:hypothetical protein
VSGKIGIIPDTESATYMLQHEAQQILARIYGYGRGNVFTPSNFLDLTSYENAQKSLTRLAKQGTIRRLMRGVYEYPAYSKLLNAPASPDPDAVARAIARAHGWTILPSGDTALNLLGLSTQVPAKSEYFSDGPSKTYQWIGGTLAFKRRANKETTILSPKTALLVQALKTLGEANVDRATIAALRKKLSEKERKRAAREARYVTSWVYERIKQLAGKS